MTYDAATRFSTPRDADCQSGVYAVCDCLYLKYISLERVEFGAGCRRYVSLDTEEVRSSILLSPTIFLRL